MEFGSTLYGSAYQEVSYGFKIEIRFKDNNNDEGLSHFYFMSNNEQTTLVAILRFIKYIL